MAAFVIATIRNIDAEVSAIVEPVPDSVSAEIYIPIIVEVSPNI